MTSTESPVLAYVEHCLPGFDLGERLRAAREHGLALEIANRVETDLETVRESRARVVAVQAYRMHEMHPLHRDPDRRVAAREYVKDSIEMARSLSARYVVTVCGFGHEICDRPLESCLDFFAAVAPWARENGVRILIEKLSRLRAGAMTEANEMESLFRKLDDRDVFGTLIDTGHLLDDGHDPASYLRAWSLPVRRFSFARRVRARPLPDAPFGEWLSALDSPPAVVSIEHRLPIDPANLGPLVKNIRAALSP